MQQALQCMAQSRLRKELVDLIPQFTLTYRRGLIYAPMRETWIASRSTVDIIKLRFGLVDWITLEQCADRVRMSHCGSEMGWLLGPNGLSTLLNNLRALDVPEVDDASRDALRQFIEEAAQL